MKTRILSVFLLLCLIISSFFAVTVFSFAEEPKVIGESKIDLNGSKDSGGVRTNETNFGDLITDAFLWAATTQHKDTVTGVPAENVVAIIEGGKIRTSISKGSITDKDIKMVFPFENTLSIAYVTGEELLETLEASTYDLPNKLGVFPQIGGMEIKINTAKSYDANSETYPGSSYYGPKTINRVTILSINGKAFNPSAKYVVVTLNSSARGDDSYYALSKSKSKTDTNWDYYEVLRDYITDGLKGVIDKPYDAPQGRITITQTENDVTATATATWVVEGKTVDSITYYPGKGEPVYFGETPTKEADEKGTYTFDKWESETDKDNNITFTAKFITVPPTGSNDYTYFYLVLSAVAALCAVFCIRALKVVNGDGSH